MHASPDGPDGPATGPAGVVGLAGHGGDRCGRGMAGACRVLLTGTPRAAAGESENSPVAVVASASACAPRVDKAAAAGPLCHKCMEVMICLCTGLSFHSCSDCGHVAHGVQLLRDCRPCLRLCAHPRLPNNRAFKPLPASSKERHSLSNLKSRNLYAVVPLFCGGMHVLKQGYYGK